MEESYEEGEFGLRIELGNDTMRTREDVAKALRDVADRIELRRGSHSILDACGNRVGSFHAVNPGK